MGYVYALIAAVLFGLNSSVTKVIVEAGISPAQLTLFRTLGTAAIAGVILLLTDRAAFRVSRRTLGVMAVLGVLGVIDHPEGDVVDPRLMAGHQFLERLPASAADLCHQLEVGRIGPGVVAERIHFRPLDTPPGGV